MDLAIRIATHCHGIHPTRQVQVADATSSSRTRKLKHARKWNQVIKASDPLILRLAVRLKFWPLRPNRSHPSPSDRRKSRSLTP